MNGTNYAAVCSDCPSTPSDKPTDRLWCCMKRWQVPTKQDLRNQKRAFRLDNVSP